MSFTQACFIRKNTPELRKKLEDLGYNKSEFGNDLNNSIATTVSNNKPSYTCIKEQSFDDTNPHTTWGFKFRIDCGTNEELFLALASLRDDTDKNQYWICDKVSVTLGKTYYPDDYIYYQYDEFFDKQNWHKETVEEIVGHFKTK